MEAGKVMATLDWSQCPAVESVPGRLSGAWVFRNTRMPVSAVFENLEAGATIDEIVEQFDISREQINEVLEFAARSLDDPATAGRRIALVVLGTPQWPVVKLHLEKIAAVVSAATPGSYTEVKFERSEEH